MNRDNRMGPRDTMTTDEAVLMGRFAEVALAGLLSNPESWRYTANQTARVSDIVDAAFNIGVAMLAEFKRRAQP